MSNLITVLTRSVGIDTLLALTDDDNLGEPNSEIIAAAVSAAEAEVNESVANQSSEPVDSTHPFWQDLIVTLAIERLFQRRRELEPGHWTERALRVRAILREIREGRRPVDPAPKREVTRAGGRPPHFLNPQLQRLEVFR